MSAASVSVDFDVPAIMRDGVRLVADVYTPAVGGGPWPVLLMRTPYGKNTYSENAWSGLDPVTAARSGFLVVIQDVRGRGASGGDWAPLTADVEDGADSVEWAAQLPGSNGQVGMFGGSYSGNTQWQAALSGTPSLRAIAPLMTWADASDGLYSRGGAAEVGLALPWTLLTGADDVYRRYAGTGTEYARLEAIIDELDHLAQQGYWSTTHDLLELIERHDVRELGTVRTAARGRADFEPADISGRQAQAGVPSFHTGGWFDIFLQGTLDNHQAMVAAGHHTRLLVGPWSHTNFADAMGDLAFGIRANRESPFVHPGGTWIDSQLGWLRGQLGGKGLDPDDDPPVRIFVMGRNQWRNESQWPPVDAREMSWYLHGDGVLSPQSPKPGVAALTYGYDLSDPVPSVGGNTFMTGVLSAGPIDQRGNESRPDVVSFTSDVLTADLEVGGRLRAHLHASSSASSVDWVVRICDVHPDGLSVNICDGVLRVRDAAGPGPHEVDLWSTSMVFAAGHRIRVDVANSSFPRWDRCPSPEGHRPQRATLSVDSSRPSWIVLPTRNP
ncbi:CocE/NonD family hydrolase [Mycolicibacterium tokaiense]|uniref:Putative peptidase n=1 Tax=Mycolicibacterium tokaiense TaxID=39695 RepID=A0A378TL18_9MYCO|nr:CocE/NonD family hydrolase [Mycolicibacterium tokaiense]BBY84991.1 X-Pro dipeptidyl-peptidase [Mycolicibacterium tokaiense]STZ60503.1 putative peptidase [Mycolicibacterium tokaiense]